MNDLAARVLALLCVVTACADGDTPAEPGGEDHAPIDAGSADERLDAPFDASSFDVGQDVSSSDIQDAADAPCEHLFPCWAREIPRSFAAVQPAHRQVSPSAFQHARCATCPIRSPVVNALARPMSFA
jgi:hypothetical protein